MAHGLRGHEAKMTRIATLLKLKQAADSEALSRRRESHSRLKNRSDEESALEGYALGFAVDTVP